MSDERVEGWHLALEPLDLEPMEEAAYGFLLAKPQATVNDLAVALGIQRNQAYRITSALEQQGLARQTLERPVRFTAKPLDDVLHELQMEAAMRMNRIHGLRKHLQRQPPPAPTRHSTLEVINGRMRAYDEVRRLVSAAEERIEIMDTHPHAVKDLSHAGLMPPLQARAQEGLDVRSILRVAPDADMPKPVRIINGETSPARWVLRDRKEAVMFVETEAGRTFRRAADRAVWTDADHVVGNLGWLFDHVWEDASES